MNIRQAIAAINAARPAGRKPVRANSAGEAQAIKFQWGVTDAIRTLARRVNFLAEAMDKAEAKVPDLERTMRQGASKAAHEAKSGAVKAARNHTAGVVSDMATALAQFNATKTRLESERDAAITEAWKSFCRAEGKAYHAYERKYDANCGIRFGAKEARERRDLLDGFYKKYRDTWFSLWNRFVAARKDAREVFAMELEAADFLMWSQLRAVRDGKPLPTADNCPGLIVVDDDGNVSGLNDPEGEKLFAMWQTQRAPGEFG